VAATDGGTQQAPGVHDDAGAGLWHSSLDRAEHADAVARIHEHLLSGDCYQVNLTRRLTRAGALDPFALFHALALEHPAPYATLFGGPVGDRDVHVVSASPECFLRRDGRAVVTRPIKGTASTAAELLASDKDHAEHTMIVDLARNDLGRVCTPGSVHVPALGVDEEHPGLHHLVSTVAGQLRDGIGLADLVAATFPPASITGAPKPRVLEIIDALEPVARGVYCGALGWIDTRTDSADLAVAIRTFTIEADTTQLGVGGGIVADSTARGEWAETELKARRLLAVAARVGERHRDDARATQAAAR
jgi:para-aminobenzoate synthetase component 1